MDTSTIMCHMGEADSWMGEARVDSGGPYARIKCGGLTVFTRASYEAALYDLGKIEAAVTAARKALFDLPKETEDDDRIA